MVLCPKARKSRSPPGIAACGSWLNPFTVKGLTLLQGWPFWRLWGKAPVMSSFRVMTGKLRAKPRNPRGFRKGDRPLAVQAEPGVSGARKNADAGWSSPVARQAHNLKVVGSNPTPATSISHLKRSPRRQPEGSVRALSPGSCAAWA